VEQLRQIFEAVTQPGLHAMIYGERGVGKTSIARVAPILIQHIHVRAVQVSCDSTDSYSTVWQKAARELTSFRPEPRMGFGASPVARTRFVLPREIVGPDDVLQLLSTAPDDSPVAVVVDEFDRLDDLESKRLMAETLKLLSDRTSPGTVVLVGIADTIEELLGHHRSIERAVVQVRMPRMSGVEIRELIQKGMTAIGLSISPDALALMVRLSSGLPHYAHLLGLHAATAATEGDKSVVDAQDVQTAIDRALTRAHEVVSTSYHRATFSPRETIFEQVLVACALAAADELGYFAAIDVREPLSSIMGRPYQIPAFARHLDELASPNRGGVLQKSGAPRRYRFRFAEPLLQPYAIMKAIAHRLIEPNALMRLTDRPKARGHLQRQT
jgi:Cdc6-like AAA superfamily ATPase